MASARERGHSDGRKLKMTLAKLRLGQAAMGRPDTKVSDLCIELGVTRQVLCRHIDPKDVFEANALKILGDREKIIKLAQLFAR